MDTRAKRLWAIQKALESAIEPVEDAFNE